MPIEPSITPPRLAAPSETRVGWIGTGVMGGPMCQHLQNARYRMTLYTRNRTKALPILAKGATWADSPRAVAEQTDVLFTMVGFPDDVREVYFGGHGVLAGSRPDMVLIDMTTTEPALACEIAEQAQARGVATIDAPVSGGDIGARNATLSIMVGGWTKAVQAVMPLFECLGKKIVHQGGPGTGSTPSCAIRSSLPARWSASARVWYTGTEPGWNCHGCWILSAGAPPPVGPWTTWPRVCWPETSIPGSSSITSSRIWASPSRKQSGGISNSRG